MLLAMATSSMAQAIRPAEGFEVIGRLPVASSQDNAPATEEGGVSIHGENRDGSLLYRVTGDGIHALVPALSGIAVAREGRRIWVFGDTIYNHSGTNGYVNLYDAAGQLIRPLGLVGRKPFATAVANDGAMVFAGNIAQEGKPLFLLSLFDASGDKRWSVMLPAAHLSRVFLSDDHQYAAVTMFYSDEYTMKTLVYDRSGRLIYTHAGNISGIAFLPSHKMVICQRDVWSCYDMEAGFRQLHAGQLPGMAVGNRPIAIHPFSDTFFILSTTDTARQVSLQAYDAASGALLAQQVFDGSGDRQRYRQLETTPEGTLQVRTEYEYISVRLK